MDSLSDLFKFVVIFAGLAFIDGLFFQTSSVPGWVIIIAILIEIPLAIRVYKAFS